MQSVLSKPVVRFAIAAAVGIHTGYTAVPALIKAELSRMVAIAAASAIGAAAVADSYYKFSSNAISNVINGSMRSSGSQTDGGRSAKTPASPSTPYTNKNGSQHVSSYPTTGLGYYGLEAGQPNQSGNYNSEEAVWRLLNAVNSNGGFKNKPPKNWPLIYHEATRGFENGLLGTLFLSYSTGNLKKFPRGSLYSSLFFALFDALTAGKNEYDKQDSTPNNKQYRIPGIPPLNETE